METSLRAISADEFSNGLDPVAIYFVHANWSNCSYPRLREWLKILLAKGSLLTSHLPVRIIDIDDLSPSLHVKLFSRILHAVGELIVVDHGRLIYLDALAALPTEQGLECLMMALDRDFSSDPHYISVRGSE